MKITTVRYRRLQSHDRGYGHDAVEAEAQVEAGESADEAFAALEAWVTAQLARKKEISLLFDTLQGLREQVRSEERSRDRVKAEAEEFRKVVKSSDRLYELAKANGLVEEAKLLFGDVPF